MIRAGIFAKVFERPSLGETLDAVAAHGIRDVQFDLSTAHVSGMPEHIDPALAGHIRAELAARGIQMSAVSGTYNMIHPDLAQRADGMRRLRTLAAACASLDTPVITLSTGTRDPVNMWRRHPDNDAPDAWRDLLAEMDQAARIAQDYGVVMAFEPEVSNVVDSAAKARALLDQIRSPWIKIVMDGANVFHAGELPRMREILSEAFALLGPDIALVHAKDLSHDGDAGNQAAGTGRLDYDLYIALLRQSGFDGPLILHSLSENEVAGSVDFLRRKIQAAGP